jgi:hypothetical protein
MDLVMFCTDAESGVLEVGLFYQNDLESAERCAVQYDSVIYFILTVVL